MNKSLIILLLFLLVGCGARYQRSQKIFSEQDFVDRALMYFEYDFDFKNKNNQYFIDNQRISIDSLKMKMTDLKESDYQMIDFKKNDCANDISNSNCGMTLKIETKNTQQTEQQKEKTLNRIKENLNTNAHNFIVRPHVCNECRLVLINFKPYKNKEALEIINEIKIEDIEYIKEFDRPLNPIFFGSSGKGGWVQIWTK